MRQEYEGFGHFSLPAAARQPGSYTCSKDCGLCSVVLGPVPPVGVGRAGRAQSVFSPQLELSRAQRRMVARLAVKIFQTGGGNISSVDR